MAKKTKDSNLSIEERLEQALIPNWDEPYKLPQNWCWTHWGNCGQFVAGGAFKEKYQGKKGLPIPFYKVGSLKYSDGFGYLYDDCNTIDENIRNELKVSVVPVNSILFAKIGEAIRLNRRSLNGVPCCIDNNLMAFIPNNKCYYKYVYYWSKGVDLYQYANATTVPAIRKADLESIPFPLAPYEAQIEIVKRIESLFIKLDEAKEKAQEVVDGFETRKAAILHKAFSGELTAKWREENSCSLDDWANTTIGAESTLITKGASPRWQGISYVEDKSQTLFITSENVREGYLDLSKEKYLDNKINEIQKRSILKKGDVLVNIVGASIGRAAIFDLDCLANINQAVCLVRVNSNVRNEFLCYFLNSPYAISYYNENKVDVARANVSLANINKMPLFLPALDEQDKIIEILNLLLFKEMRAKETAETVIEQIDTMKKAILARAFRGELGTNDPSEESALELLKKIL